MANSVAIKKSQLNVNAPAEFVTMGTVRCEGCGEEFVALSIPLSSLIVAERQAHWLEKVLADDKKHPDRIELPE